MFFILSKTVSYLVMPLTVVVGLFIASVLIRNATWKKRCFWSAFVLLLLFSNQFIANELMRAWEVPAVPFSEVKPHKVGIVLTGATMPHREPDDRVYFNRGADRVTHTVQLFKAGLIERILISGGTGRLFGADKPEAVKFKEAMMLMGVPEDAILLEPETRNTGESPREVKKILEANGFQDRECLLITSAFHMRRSLASYRKAGLAPQPFSTDFYSVDRSFHLDVLLIPKVDAIVVWHKLTKEWIGMIAYKIVGYS